MKLKQFFLNTIYDDLYTMFSIMMITFGVLLFYDIFNQNIFLAFLPSIFTSLGYSALVMPLTKHIAKLGTKKILIVGVLITILSGIPIFLFTRTDQLIYIILWSIMVVFSKLFFHVPVLYIYARNSSHENRTSTFSLNRINMIIVAVVTPLLSGLLSESYGLEGLFLFAVLIQALGIIPALMMEDNKIEFDGNFKKLNVFESFKYIKQINYFRWWGLVGNRIWILYIFIVFSSSYSTVGILLAMTSGISIVLVFLLGKYLSDHDRHKTTQYMFRLDSVSWFLRAFSGVFPISIPLLDTIGKFTQELKSQSSVILAFDWITDGVPKEFEDDLIVYREFHVNLFVTIAYVVLILLIYLTSFEFTFFIIGILTLSYSFVRIENKE